MRIIVSGMVAADPGQGGAAWAVLQYVLGLERLGHEVMLIEQCEPAALRPQGARFDRSENAAYFRSLVREFELEQHSALLLAGSHETVGLPYRRLATLAAEADVLLDVSGLLTDPELSQPPPVRAYLDLDPAFNQLWDESGIDMRFDGHTHFVTVGQALGTPSCAVPTRGREWIPTLPPVVLERWPATEPAGDAWTTVGNWRGYGSIERDGIHFGQKAHSLRTFVALPTRVSAGFVLALAIHPDEHSDLEALAQNGWKLVDPLAVAATPAAYADFIRSSRGELGVAKSGYVVSRCGWFSDRSACYLASGRPVVAQDTGFGAFLPTGEGLLAFSTEDEAGAAIEEVERDYDRHRAAARTIAEERLDSDRVLGSLLERLGVQ